MIGQHSLDARPSTFGAPLSRTSSVSSGRESPARPPKAIERRRSSDYTVSSLPTASQSRSRAAIAHDQRSPRSTTVGLSVVTSSPLSPIRAGSTPVSPVQRPDRDSRASYTNNLDAALLDLPSPTMDAILAQESEDSQVSSTFAQATSPPNFEQRPLLGRHPSASASTAFSDITMYPTGAHLPQSNRPLKLESTTNSKNTVIKDRRRKITRNPSTHSHGSVSSDSVFTSNSMDEHENSRGTSSKLKKMGRRMSLGRRSKPSLYQERGISSDDVFSSSPASDGLGSPPMGSTKRGSRPTSPRAATPTSIASAGSQASGQSLLSRRSSSSRLSLFKRRTSEDRREEEEQLQILADLRLRALALASGGDATDNSMSLQDKTNAELLVKEMRKSGSQTSSTYSQPSPRVDANGQLDNSDDSAYSSQGEDDDIKKPTVAEWERDVREAQVPPGELEFPNEVEDESTRNAFLDANKRRSTLQTIKGLDMTTPSATDGGRPLPDVSSSSKTSRTKRQSGLWHIRSSVESRDALASLADYPEDADPSDALEDEAQWFAGSGRRRSTVGPYSSGLPRSVSQQVEVSPKSSDNQQEEKSSSIEGDSEPIAPPLRMSSRAASSTTSLASPLRSRTTSSAQSPEQLLTTPDRTASTKQLNSHAREGATASPTLPAMTPIVSNDTQILDELNDAIGVALSEVRGSPVTQPNPLPVTSPNARNRDIPIHVQPHDTLQEDAQSTKAMTGLHHRRTSSESVPLTQILPTYRRTSSSDLTYLLKSQSPTSATHRRASSAVPASISPTARNMQARDPIPGYIELPAKTELAVTNWTLSRNKPLPAAVVYKDELRKCHVASERAELYARKINELHHTRSGLQIWIMNAKEGRSMSAALHSKGDIPSRSIRSASIHNFGGFGHSARDEQASSATFPARSNSQDFYRARDITQRAPSIAPSSMVPSTIPYPGVYNSSHNLSSGLQSAGAVSTKQGFTSSALNAAGLPSRVGFFGLGRKGSKRVGSNNHGRHRDGGSNLSISSPLQPPPEPTIPSSTSRQNLLRPSGPRPSFSSSSSDSRDYAYQPGLPSQPSHSSIHSLSAGSSYASPQYNPSAPVQTAPSPLSYSSTAANDDDSEALTYMSDILPQASKEVLAEYLTCAQGDHVLAISRYVDDEKSGKV